MEYDEWYNRILKETKAAGTYRTYYDPVIETLANILEKRDKAEDDFWSHDGKIIVEYANKAGKVNMVQNPTLKIINELNRDALAYWRDLGLTPSGLKKINGYSISSQKRTSALEEALKKLSG